MKSREEYTAELVASDHPKRVVVAGPGTGKTTAFEGILEQQKSKGLVLTFINSLVNDLEGRLAHLADVFTLHKFCKMLLYKNEVDGVKVGFHHYPALPTLLAADIGVDSATRLSKKELQAAIRSLNECDQLDAALSFAARYNAVGHDEIIYRVLKLFEGNPFAIPEYSIVIVDEFQDFNNLEASLIFALARQNQVLISGDDDQSLYGFKEANPSIIRQLANDNAYKRFELPYCSRCTDVLVAAANDFAKFAEDQGALSGRVPKLFLPHESKAEASKRYPKIVHAACTTNRKNAYYSAEYITRELRKLTDDDFNEAAANDCLAALIIGPGHIVKDVHGALSDEFPWVQKKDRTSDDIVSIDGYRKIAQDGQSELGWRIVGHCHLPIKIALLESEASQAETPLVEKLAPDFRAMHEEAAELVNKLLAHEELSETELGKLQQLTQMPLEEVCTRIGVVDIGDVDEEVVMESPPISESDQVLKTGLATTILSSKGLSALHVFIVGVMEGGFPKNSMKLTEEEACSFLVALTRARSSCHILTIDRYGGGKFGAPPCLNSIARHLTKILVNKAYLTT